MSKFPILSDDIRKLVKEKRLKAENAFRVGDPYYYVLNRPKLMVTETQSQLAPVERSIQELKDRMNNFEAQADTDEQTRIQENLDTTMREGEITPVANEALKHDK